MQEKNKKIGILNKGKDNKFINNEFHGFDVGIQDEGQHTLATGNKFHGVEKYIEDIKDLPLWLKYVVAVFAIIGTIGTLYGIYATFIQPKQLEAIPQSITTSTVNISDIFYRYNEMDRAIDQQNFLKKYLDVPIYGLGTLDDISGSFGDDSTYYLHLSVPGSLVSCQFSNVDQITKHRLDLIKSGAKISFLGTFAGSIMFESKRWFIRDCKFVN